MKTFLAELIKAHVSGIATMVAIGAAALAATGCSGDANSENAASSSADAVCATGGTLEGVDVSEFQAAIDWNAVKASGRSFAIARVADGLGHVDPTFPQNWAGIKAAGMVRGVYQFYRASQDGTAQANLLLDHVGALGAGDLPPVLDVEVTDGVGAAQILSGIRAWTARIQQATGRKPIIYTAPGFWDGLGAGHDFEAADTLWVADWFVSCPVPASSWGTWKMWQYVDNGSVPGIGGAVDLDRFSGSLADLDALAAGGATNEPYYRGMARDASGNGYWLVGSDGGVFTFGDAAFYGSMGGKTLNAPVVAIAATPSGKGYWLAASDGGLFSFGDAGFYGSMGGKTLNAPIVGMASSPSGAGYWLVASDGGLFAFGDAGFHGSMGGQHLNAPVVGMSATPNGQGYWLVAADGGMFAFGNAGFYGSMGGQHLNAPVVGMSASADGKGYWLVASDGGLFSFGDAPFDGSMGGKTLNSPVVGMAATPSGAGYWFVGGDGGLFAFGNAGFFGSRAGAAH